MDKVKSKTPKLRFPEFTDDWESNQLSRIVKINPKNKNLPNQFVYIDLESVVQGNLVKQEQIKLECAPSRAQRILSNDDILFQTVRPYQMNNYYFNLGEGYVASTGYAQLRTKDSPRFIYQYLHTRRFVNKVLIRCTGTSYPAINSSDLGKINIAYPSEEEQQKIALFLTAVDDKIQQLTKKKELLEKYKKGVMQKIFPSTSSGQVPEIRFKDDDGNEYPDWEKKTLGDISTEISYGMNCASTEFDGENKYIRITDIDDKTNRFCPSPLTSPKENIDDKYLLKKGDILFARTGASVGKTYHYLRDDGKLYYAGFLIKASIREANSFFIFSQTLLTAYKKWVTVMSMRSGQPGINAEEYRTLKLSYPSIPEQQKIADFLSSIDKKIDFVNTQLEKTKEFKKGLLQQMFV